MAKSDNNNSKVSVTAWNKTIDDFNARFDKIESMIKELTEKMDKKVNIKAWEKSLVDIDNEVKKFTFSELKELDNRLDKTVELITELTTHLNEKVTVTAWDRLCESNEQLMKKVDSLSESNEDVSKRMIKIENMLKDAKVSEEELRELMESI